MSNLYINRNLIKYMDDGDSTGLLRVTVLSEIINQYEALQTDDYFNVSCEDIERETGINKEQQKNVYPYLEKLGLIKRWFDSSNQFIKLNAKACKELIINVNQEGIFYEKD